MTTVTVNAWCAPQKLRLVDGSIVVVQPGESLTADFDDAQMREIEVSPGHFTVGKPVEEKPVHQNRQARRGRR